MRRLKIRSSRAATRYGPQHQYQICIDTGAKAWHSRQTLLCHRHFCSLINLSHYLYSPECKNRRILHYRTYLSKHGRKRTARNAKSEARDSPCEHGRSKGSRSHSRADVFVKSVLQDCSRTSGQTSTHIAVAAGGLHILCRALRFHMGHFLHCEQAADWKQAGLWEPRWLQKGAGCYLD